MITQRIDQLTYSDIEKLVEQGVPEGRQLDYKRQLPSGKSEDIKELLADVTSFANANGGHLVYGITTKKIEGKNTDLPDQIIGLGDINGEQETLRLDNLFRSSIQPRITGLRVKAIRDVNKPPVLVIHIPKSWNAPHMVANGSDKFFSRTSAGKYGLDVTEIRHAFAMSEAVGERVRAFRDERIGRILSGDTPVPTSPGATLVLHFIPLEAFAEHSMFEIETLRLATRSVSPLGLTSWSSRNNLDGLLLFRQNRNAPEGNYLQIFRNGVIESVDTALMRANEPQKSLPIFAIELAVVKECDQIVKAMKSLSSESPSIIFLSFLNVRNYILPNDHGFMPNGYPIDREHLLLPDLLVDDLNMPVVKFLKPAFDLLWQSCGETRCHHYDDDGNWLGPL